MFRDLAGTPFVCVRGRRFDEVMPEEKAARIKEAKRRGLTVAMVGYGVNDAPALAESDLGIAIGAGTEVAVESSNIVLVRSDPRDVAAILHLARATYAKMVQNLLWASGYNMVAIPLSAVAAAAWGNLLTHAAGAVLMSASTVIGRSTRACWGATASPARPGIH